MLTRTRSHDETKSFSEYVDTEATLKDLQEQVDERGFYLYNWITPDELRMSIQADYLSIIKNSSIPLAIVTGIMAVIGFGWAGIFGSLIVVFGVLLVFYVIVGLILIVKMIQKSILYTRGANVVVTDDYYVSGGHVLKKSDFEGQKEAFRVMETLFREPIFQPSELREYIDLEKKSLFEKLKSILSGGGELISRLGRSRNSGGLVMVLLLAGMLYGGMMAFVYFLGVFFVSVLALVFSWIAHHILLIVDNTEHEIQNLFQLITASSIDLKAEKKKSISLLSEAGRNEWKDNLSQKLEDSFKEVEKSAEEAMEKSLALRSLLESSKYKEIFNFKKYGNWIKTQVIEPIDEIYELLLKNKDTIEDALSRIDIELTNTKEKGGILSHSGKKSLELQKERLLLQKESFDRMLNLLKGYREKLQ